MLEWPLEYIVLQILSNEIKSILKYNLKLCNESQEELYSNLPHIFGSITTECVDNGKKNSKWKGLITFVALFVRRNNRRLRPNS